MSQPLYFILTGDWHITNDSNNRNNKNVKHRLKLIIDEMPNDVPFIIGAAGDLTNNGMPLEYTNLTDIVEEVGVNGNIFSVLGNHDITKLGNLIICSGFDEAAFQHGRKFCDEVISETVFNLGGEVHNHDLEHFEDSKLKKLMRVVLMHEHKVVFLLLDSNVTEDDDASFARGEIGTKQMKLIEQYLQARQLVGYTKVLMLHHHPIFNDFFQLLKDSDEFLKLWWGVPNTLVAFAHKHHRNMWSNGNDSFVASAHDLKSKQTIKVQVFCLKDGKVFFDKYLELPPAP